MITQKDRTGSYERCLTANVQSISSNAHSIYEGGTSKTGGICKIKSFYFLSVSCCDDEELFPLKYLHCTKQ